MMHPEATKSPPTFTNLHDSASLQPPSEFESSASPKYSGSKQQRVCWCMPLAVSFLLMILLGATSSVITSTAEIKLEQTDIVRMEHHDSPLVTLAPFMAPTEAANEDSVHFWLNSIAKPILLEVGALALFQSMGALPTLTKVLMSSHRLHGKVGWIRLFSAKNLLIKANKLKWRSPRMVRRIHESVKKIYQKRSRLSAASDMTHVIGDDMEDNTTHTHGNNNSMAAP